MDSHSDTRPDPMDIRVRAIWDNLIEDMQLSPRQTQIMQGIFRGQADKQIAAELAIAVPTVRTHLSRLFMKFDVQDRVGLVLHVVAIFLNECRHNQCNRINGSWIDDLQ